MKKLITFISLVLFATALFAQTPTNYKEGDFTGKQLKSKSIKLDNNWLIDKGSTGTISWKYNGTSVMTLTSAGVLTPTTASFGAGTYTTGNFTTSLTSPSVSATTTLTLPGTTTVTKTTSNANSATFSGSIVADTLTAPIISGSTSISTPSLSATTTLTLPGTSNTVTKTTSNANSLTVSNSLNVGDTLACNVVTAAATVKTLKPLLVGTGTVADSTSALYMWSKDGTKWRISVANSGVIYMVTVTP